MKLVYVGKSARKLHQRTDGKGVLPAGRAACELSTLGTFMPYYTLTDRTISPTYDAGEGQPTCLWCRTRDLQAA